jgi:hypothetical protein
MWNTIRKLSPEQRQPSEAEASRRNGIKSPFTKQKKENSLKSSHV